MPYDYYFIEVSRVIDYITLNWKDIIEVDEPKKVKNYKMVLREIYSFKGKNIRRWDGFFYYSDGYLNGPFIRYRFNHKELDDKVESLRRLTYSIHEDIEMDKDPERWEREQEENAAYCRACEE